MFGDLFEEQDTTVVYGPSPRPVQRANGGKVEAPPPGRGDTGFSGIKNQGATCYLNSLIQTLLLTPELREELFRLGPDELGRLEDAKKANAKVRKIPIQLQLLLARLLLLDQYACSTEGLTESFGWVDSEQLQQHDVQELSRILFCAIEDSLVGTSGHDLIKKLYRGVTANTITCLDCGKVSENAEDFLDLNVAIAGQCNLESVLRDMFVETELMNGKNQYRCENCSKLVDARKGAVIKTLPPILTVSFLRFSFDYSTLRRFKETKKFEFPLTLNMKPYCRSSVKGECHEYDLYSVIIHSGSAHGGHYHAYIRDVDGLGIVPPDYDPTPPKPVELHNSPEKASNADYIDDPVDMLAYVLGKLGGEGVPITKLGDGFREESGSSWAKQYKRKYGTMTKFLQYHYNTFVVDTRTKTVSFRQSVKSERASSSNPHSPTNRNHPPENGSGDRKSVNGPSYTNVVKGQDLAQYEIDFVNEVINGGLDHGDAESQSALNCSTDSENHPLCNIWFDFNDSHVRPITTHDIESQFEGRESAYMLFYRRRDLRRPLESLGNAVGCIPDHIKSTINQENCHLDDLRTEYDYLLNLVMVSVYFPSMFDLCDGLIKLRSSDSSSEPDPGIVHTIDRRKTIKEMMEEMEAMFLKHYPGKDDPKSVSLQCHILVELDHHGVHLYDRVDETTDISVNDSILKNGAKLLLWGGDTLLGVTIKPGEQHEPVLLTMNCVISGANSVSVTFSGVAPSNVTVGHLKEHFLAKLDLTDAAESKMYNQKSEVEFGEDDLLKALADLKTGCEMEISLQVTLPDAATEPSSADDVHLQVSLGETLTEKLKNRGYFGRTGQGYHLNSIRGQVTMCTTRLVGDLKELVLRWLLPDHKTVCDFALHLCLGRDADCLGSTKLRLHECDNLVEAGLKSEAGVMLEFGLPPAEFEYDVVVYIQKGNKLKLPVTKNPSVPVALSKKRTVSQFLSTFVSKNALGSEPWHLRLLKSDREVGDVVVNVDCKIEKTLIKHGCSLVLCPGGIPSEGVVRIPIWHYPRSVSLTDTLKEADGSEVSAIMQPSKSRSLWRPFLPDEVAGRKMAGHVEIGKEATLYDLKEEIVKLPFFSEKKVEDICLRSVSQGLPTRFHTQDNSTVKRLRLGPGAALAVQDASGVPESNVISLRLTFHVTGTRRYCNPCEYLWDLSLPPSQMPFELAVLLGIGVKEILIARRSSEVWQWEIIKHRESDKSKEVKQKNSVKRGAKQKKGLTKTKTKKAASSKSPSQVSSASFKDGDVIRIKNISMEVPDQEGSPEISDFKSDEDIAAMQRTQDAHSKDAHKGDTEECTDDGAASSSTTAEKAPASKARKEETLRIHVDKFS